MSNRALEYWTRLIHVYIAVRELMRNIETSSHRGNPSQTPLETRQIPLEISSHSPETIKSDDPGPFPFCSFPVLYGHFSFPQHTDYY